MTQLSYAPSELSYAPSAALADMPDYDSLRMQSTGQVACREEHDALLELAGGDS